MQRQVRRGGWRTDGKARAGKRGCHYVPGGRAAFTEEVGSLAGVGQGKGDQKWRKEGITEPSQCPFLQIIGKNRVARLVQRLVGRKPLLACFSSTKGGELLWMS